MIIRSAINGLYVVILCGPLAWAGNPSPGPIKPLPLSARAMRGQTSHRASADCLRPVSLADGAANQPGGTEPPRSQKLAAAAADVLFVRRAVFDREKHHGPGKKLKQSEYASGTLTRKGPAGWSLSLQVDTPELLSEAK